jgi:hypothetical protein
MYGSLNGKKLSTTKASGVGVSSVPVLGSCLLLGNGNLAHVGFPGSCLGDEVHNTTE